MKRLLSALALALAVAIDLFAATEIDGLVYELFDHNLTAELRDVVDRKRQQITVPASVNNGGNDYQVTRLTDGVFSGCEALQRVTLPASVSSIAFGAFYGCPALTSIVVPPDCRAYQSRHGCLYNVNSDGQQQLYICPGGRRQLAIEVDVEQIFPFALSDCNALSSFVVSPGNTVFKTEGGALYTADGRQLVACAGALTSYTLPANVDSVRVGAFTPCLGLRSIAVEEGDTLFASVDGLLVKADGHTLVACPPGRSGELSVPEWCWRLADGAFAGCLGLKRIAFAPGTYALSDFCCLNCGGLQTVELPSTVRWVGDFAFAGCSELAELTLPERLTMIGQRAFLFCYSLQRLIIPASVSFLPAGCLSECWSLRQVALPDKLREVGSLAFYQCSALTELTVPASVTKLGDLALYGCQSLKALALPGVGFLGRAALSDCYGLSQLTLGHKLTYIGAYCFANTSLTELTIPSGPDILREGLCFQCQRLERVAVPASVVELEASVFLGCAALRQVGLAEGLQRIGPYAFGLCTSLHQLALPSTLRADGLGRDLFLQSGLQRLNLASGFPAEARRRLEAMLPQGALVE